MSSNTLDITTDQGSTLNYVFTLVDVANNPFDLTGCDVRLQVRQTYGATNILINCTLANSKVVVTMPNIITLALLPADTSSIRFLNKDDDTLDCVYDLEVQNLAGNVYKPARGSFTINREVTR